jgi:hypothetical protein
MSPGRGRADRRLVIDHVFGDNAAQPGLGDTHRVPEQPAALPLAFVWRTSRPAPPNRVESRCLTDVRPLQQRLVTFVVVQVG